MGLRRGFIQAGAQNLLMTLWAVADQYTVRFMVAFYDMIHKTGDAPQVLADVQKEWLVRSRRLLRKATPWLISGLARSGQAISSSIRLCSPAVHSTKGFLNCFWHSTSNQASPPRIAVCLEG